LLTRHPRKGSIPLPISSAWSLSCQTPFRGLFAKRCMQLIYFLQIRIAASLCQPVRSRYLARRMVRRVAPLTSFDVGIVEARMHESSVDVLPTDDEPTPEFQIGNESGSPSVCGSKIKDSVGRFYHRRINLGGSSAPSVFSARSNETMVKFTVLALVLSVVSAAACPSALRRCTPDTLRLAAFPKIGAEFARDLQLDR
jgi:hypothetical protein